MTTPTIAEQIAELEETDDERLLYLMQRRKAVRESIAALEEDNATSLTFEDRSINHLPLEQLKRSEAIYTVKINDLIIKREAPNLSYILGQTIQYTRD